MTDLERFGVSMPESLLADFDRAITDAGYASRSEAIRDIVRDYLVRRQWERPVGDVVGTLTLVYDHHTHELQDALTGLQHEHTEAIVCCTHVHLSAHLCLEVIVMRASSEQVRAIADRLLSTRGVKHGGLIATSAVPGP